MTKRVKIWLMILLYILVVLGAALTVKYQSYKEQLTDQPPYFDLFLADFFFKPDESKPYERVSFDQERPIVWHLDKEQFEVLDSLSLSLTNTSGEKFYYTSWGAPFTWLQQDFIIYKDGIADTITFKGHGCGTGIYAAPLKNEETMSRLMVNPLRLNPYSNYELPLSSDTFPRYFKELFGDSVAISFSQETYSLPWHKYKSQLITSDYMVISTEKVLNNWRMERTTNE